MSEWDETIESLSNPAPELEAVYREARQAILEALMIPDYVWERESALSSTFAYQAERDRWIRDWSYRQTAKANRESYKEPRIE